MSSELFTNSGAVITALDHQTFLGSSISFNVRAKSVLDPAQVCFVVPEFSLKNLNQKIIFTHVYSLKQVLEDMTENSNSEINLKWTNSAENYQSKYFEAMDKINSGELKKAVPFTCFETCKPENFNRVLLPQILKRLNRIKTENEYFYGSWSSNEGFLGLTPEVLVQKEHNSTMYRTMALAGTLPVRTDSAEATSMLLNPKLKEEHAFVMDDISNKLKDHHLLWSDPVEKVYGILKHLYATAEFKSELSIQNLILRLSPTSALGVYPSERWSDYSELLGIETRGSYGAPFGWVHKEEINILVCLRGLFWDEKKLKIYVGGGVTSQSDFDTELKELELKFLSTKNKLGL